MTPPPLVTVIVPVFNERDRIGACLRALEAQSYPRDRIETIVVDNGSTDGTPEVAQRMGGVTVLVHPGGGSYAARNAGLTRAKGEVIAFTDADCLPDARWIEEGVRALTEGPYVGLVGGRIDVFPADADAPSFIEALDMVVELRQDEFVRRPGAPFAATANAFTSRAVIQTVGPFRADLYSSGDVEFGTRVAAAGRAVVYAPDAMVRHPARATLRAAVRRLRRVRYGRYIVARRGAWTDLLSAWRAAPRGVRAAWRRRDLGLRTRIKAAVAAILLTVIRYWIGVLLVLTGRPFLRPQSLKGY
ncbi:MAG TPA: glycosyltransferase [Gemmatimonadales bacterium]